MMLNIIFAENCWSHIWPITKCNFIGNSRKIMKYSTRRIGYIAHAFVYDKNREWRSSKKHQLNKPAKFAASLFFKISVMPWPYIWKQIAKWKVKLIMNLVIVTSVVVVNTWLWRLTLLIILAGAIILWSSKAAGSSYVGNRNSSPEKGEHNLQMQMFKNGEQKVNK